MKLHITSFLDGGRIPAEFAFAKPAEVDHVTFAGNTSPHVSWSDVPPGTKSLAMICVDPDAPTVADDVNQEGRTVSKDLPRGEFYHWSIIDLSPDVRELAAGECGAGVVPGGKSSPPGPAGSRQGKNDYTSWFATTEGMAGDYLGYDGPAPPWNDELVHRYVFTLYALDVPRLELPDGFHATDALNALTNHVLAQATWTGTYTQNPHL